jgi:transcriptional regulator with XRE-family HTH domain
MATFGERFKLLRLEKGLTQDKLAETFFTKKSSISRYENNLQIPEIESLQKYADFFGVSIDYLLGRSNVKNPESTNLSKAEELIKVDPDLFVDMCRATELPDDVRKRIREYAAYELEKHLREQQNKKNGNK